MQLIIIFLLLLCLCISSTASPNLLLLLLLRRGIDSHFASCVHTSTNRGTLESACATLDTQPHGMGIACAWCVQQQWVSLSSGEVGCSPTATAALPTLSRAGAIPSAAASTSTRSRCWCLLANAIPMWRRSRGAPLRGRVAHTGGCHQAPLRALAACVTAGGAATCGDAASHHTATACCRLLLGALGEDGEQRRRVACSTTHHAASAAAAARVGAGAAASASSVSAGWADEVQAGARRGAKDTASEVGERHQRLGRVKRWHSPKSVSRVASMLLHERGWVSE